MSNKNYNYGIAFMKAFLSFLVVCCHYWSAENLEYYPVSMMYRMRGVAVPIFVIMSFFLTEKIYTNKKVHKMKERVRRLLVPFISWAVLYYWGYKVIDVILKGVGFHQGLNISYSYKDFLWQICMGHSQFLCPQMWYLFDIILLSIIFGVIFMICNEYSWYLIIIFGIVALGLQYFGINYMLFSDLSYEMRYPLGRLAEVFPLASIGLLLAYSNILEKIKKHQMIVTLICIMTMLVITYGGLFKSPTGGFGYGGIYNIAYSTIAFILFYEIPFEKMWIGLRKILKILSKYSLGVYCIHYGVGYCWNNVLCVYFGWKINTFIECIWIYVICIFISWGVSRISMKYLRQLVE